MIFDKFVDQVLHPLIAHAPCGQEKDGADNSQHVLCIHKYFPLSSRYSQVIIPKCFSHATATLMRNLHSGQT